jgi:hypothetical protein
MPNVLRIVLNIPQARSFISGISLLALLTFTNGCSEKKDVSPPESSSIATNSSSAPPEIGSPDSPVTGTVGTDGGGGVAKPYVEPASSAPIREFEGLEPSQSPE